MSKVTIGMKLDILSGCEVMSIKHEGCVYIKSGRNRKAFVNGDEFELTNEDINYLYKKLIKDEGF